LRVTRRRIAPLVATLAVLAAAVPAVLAATPNRIAPTQRIDVKLLLLSADGTEPGFGACKATIAGTGLVLGGALAVALVLPAVVALLSRPASTLATALWIP
jgi:hypothetical protein